MIQEHWLYPDELSYLSHLSKKVCLYSKSAMSIKDKLLEVVLMVGLV